MKEALDHQVLCNCCSRRRRRIFVRPAACTVIMLTAAMRCTSAWIQHQHVCKRAAPLSLATDSRRLRFESRSVDRDLFAEFAYYIKSKTVESRSICSAATATATMEQSMQSVFSGGDERRSASSNDAVGKYHRLFHSGSSTVSERSSSDAGAGLRPPMQSYGRSVALTPDEELLFRLLKEVREQRGLTSTLRVAGGWVRDKLLATPEFQSHHQAFAFGSGQRLTSKFRRQVDAKRAGPKSLGFSEHAGKPVDIDIALDDMLGREFADHLNDYLSSKGEDTVSVGVVLKNPEKSKHLETATMKVGSFWIDFVNLRAEEYTQDSRIPDLMRIGTASEDAFRRDLTINALFYNINSGQVEDWTGRGLADLQKGIVATPLPPLTTLLDDPLRVLRSIRFAARLRFIMDEELVEAAKDARVRQALAQKVSRERIGSELDLMLRSPDPVGAMRLLINLNLADTVLPMTQYTSENIDTRVILQRGLSLLSTAYDYLTDCRWSPPLWCQNLKQTYGEDELTLKDDDKKRRLLWYASFLKPLHDAAKKVERVIVPLRAGKKAGQSALVSLLVNDLKRPVKDAEMIELIMETADELSRVVDSGHYVSAIMILLSDIQVARCPVNGTDNGGLRCSMNGRLVDSTTEEDPVWQHAMEFRQLCAPIMKRIGSYWRAALLLAISEQLALLESEGLQYTIEGDIFHEVQSERRQGIIEKYDAFATALQEVGLIGIENEKPLLCGDAIKRILTKIPRGPAFRDVMDEQMRWMTGHPGSQVKALISHLTSRFPEYV